MFNNDDDDEQSVTHSFDKKLPSALKVENVEAARSFLTRNIRNGYRIVKPNFINNGNPVVDSKELPDIKVDNWIILEGKTIRVINHVDEEKANLIKYLEQQRTINPNSKVVILNTDQSYTQNSYARIAGAYLRWLEREQGLKALFNKFFFKKQCNLKTGGKKIDVSKIAVFYNLQLQEEIEDFFLIKLKDNVQVTKENLDDFKSALGVTIKEESLQRSSTIYNVLKFSKMLEILAANIQSLPMICDFNYGTQRKTVSFIISKYLNTEQLLISVCGNKDNGALNYFAHSYMNLSEVVDPMVAIRILDAPLSNTDSIENHMLEFLVCTHIAESHANNNELNKSRVPGMGKLARAMLRRIDSKSQVQMQMQRFFSNSNCALFPMAGEGGTSNGRNAVNSLSSTGGGRASSNTYAYDMSDDSDIEVTP